MDDHKFSLRSSFKTGISSCGNDFSHSCAHSWKCYINPTVNYEYHQLMLQKSPSLKTKLPSSQKRPVSQMCIEKFRKTKEW